MLVWKAIASMTPMMSAILRDEAQMPDMVVTTRSTTSPPLRAASDAPTASWLAWRAWPAFCATVDVSCFIELAVCSSVLACSPVRRSRSTLPWAIRALLAVTMCAPCVTSPSTVRRLAIISARACSSCAASSRPSRCTCAVRSPPATWRDSLAAKRSGRTMADVISQENVKPRLMAMAQTPMMTSWPQAAACCELAELPSSSPP